MSDEQITAMPLAEIHGRDYDRDPNRNTHYGYNVGDWAIYASVEDPQGSSAIIRHYCTGRQNLQNTLNYGNYGLFTTSKLPYSCKCGAKMPDRVRQLAGFMRL